MEIKAIIEFDSVRVTFNGVTHLRFMRSKFLGIQSWFQEPTAQWFIEITRVGGVITSD